MSEHLIGIAKPCCVLLGLASIASGRPLEDAEEEERIPEEEEEEEEQEEEEDAAAVTGPQMFRP